MFNKAVFIVGMPLIYVYVFSVWTIEIVVIAIIAESKNVEERQEHKLLHFRTNLDVLFSIFVYHSLSGCEKIKKLQKHH
ncbi:MAG: hypothetical protein U5M51_01270 [Emticicia sp.]|nr:hypothetical protein [Emticicia sp.]